MRILVWDVVAAEIAYTTPFIDVPGDAFRILKTGLATPGGIRDIVRGMENFRFGQTCAGIWVIASPSLI